MFVKKLQENDRAANETTVRNSGNPFVRNLPVSPGQIENVPHFYPCKRMVTCSSVDAYLCVDVCRVRDILVS